MLTRRSAYTIFLIILCLWSCNSKTGGYYAPTFAYLATSGLLLLWYYPTSTYGHALAVVETQKSRDRLADRNWEPCRQVHWIFLTWLHSLVLLFCWNCHALVLDICKSHHLGGKIVTQSIMTQSWSKCNIQITESNGNFQY